MADFSIRGGDKWKGVLAKVATECDAMGVKAGVLKGSSTTGHGATVAEYAFYNEYGAPGAHIPARPFMRTSVLQHQKEWVSIFRRYAEGKSTDPAALRKAFDMAGRAMAGDMIAMIKSNMEPENAESTKARKEKKVTERKHTEGEERVTSMTPGTLQDTGLLINSINHELIEG